MIEEHGIVDHVLVFGQLDETEVGFRFLDDIRDRIANDKAGSRNANAIETGPDQVSRIQTILIGFFLRSEYTPLSEPASD
jgi:hypothetical protein